MKHRIIGLVCVATAIVFSGCSGNSPYMGENLLSNTSTRIAPPGTNLGSKPQQVATLPPDPYYGRTPGGTVQVNGANGWLPAGATAPGNQMASGYSVPASSLTVASNTSTGTIFGGTTMAANTTGSPLGANPYANPYPSSTAQPTISYGTPQSGALPLNDATKMTTAQVPNNNGGTPYANPYGTSNGFVTQPNAVGNPAQPQYNPQYSNGTVVASSSTIPGFTAAPTTGYSATGTWQTGQVPNANYANPPTANVANGWSQRPPSR